MIKLFVNGEQIRLPNNKTTNLDWYYQDIKTSSETQIPDLRFTIRALCETSPQLLGKIIR